MSQEHKRRKTDLVEIPDDVVLRRVRGAQQLIRLMKNEKPKAHHSYHIISGGNVDLICHLRYILDMYHRIDWVFISAWSISGSDILLLKQWYDHQKVIELNLLVGDVYPKNYKKEWEKLNELACDGFIKNLYHSTIHSKLLLIRCGNDKIVVESSANCNMNPRVEQSVLTLSDQLFDFYVSYFDDLFKNEDRKEKARS